MTGGNIISWPQEVSTNVHVLDEDKYTEVEWSCVLSSKYNNEKENADMWGKTVPAAAIARRGLYMRRASILLFFLPSRRAGPSCNETSSPLEQKTTKDIDTCLPA
jgi:hypothetical protein